MIAAADVRQSQSKLRLVRRGGSAIELLDKRVPHWDRNFQRVLFEEQWIKNCAYFAGKQHFALIGNQLVEVPPGEHEIRYKVNYIKPAVLRSVAKILNLQGRFAVAPKNGSPRAREIARTSDAVFSHQREVTDYNYEKMMAYIMAAVCGTSFLRTLWDPEKGEPDRFYWFDKKTKFVIPPEMLTGEERALRDREQMYDEFAPGEISCEAVMSFQVYPDLASRGKIEHCRHITTASYVDRKMIAEVFNVDEEDLDVAGATQAAARYDEALAYMTTGMNGSMMGIATPISELDDRTWFRQSWERPSKQYPFGRYIAAAGEMLLIDDTNPYAGDKSKCLHLPFEKVDWIPALNRFWSLALVDDLTSPQFRHNESRARMFEFERIHGRSAIFVPKGSGIPPGELSIKQGQVIEFNPMKGMIQFAPTPQLPSEVFQNAQSCKREISDLSTGSEVDGKSLPAQLRSGEAVEQMRQERDIILSVTSQGALRVDHGIGRKFLALGQMFYDTKRLATYRGPNGQWGILQFTSADLSNDLKIIGEPGTIETVSQQRSAVLDAVQMGALVPAQNPQHAQIVVKALRFNTSEEAIDDILMHEQRQEREIRDILQNVEQYRGIPYPIMPFEDHAAHKRVIERFAHTDDWQFLTKEQQAALLTHWTLHDQAEQAKLAQLVALQESARGAPGAKGQASQPR